MDIVRNYGKESYLKVAAVKSILAAFSESIQYEDTLQDHIDAAIDIYIAMLDEHDNSRRLAAARSGRLEAINDEDDEGADQADTTLLTPSQELTCNLVQNHLLDLKSSKRMVLGSKWVPEFPDSEWNNVPTGKAVNVDVVFSGMYSTITDNRTIENIGDLKLHFRAAKPAKTVETHRDWVIAWRSVFKATKFIFPHCEAKLNEYNNYITSYFASIHPSAHLRVLNLNRAIRKQVGSVNNISLNEFGKFHYLETHHLQGHGAGESSIITKKRVKPKDGPDSSWRKADPCHLWNDGRCGHQASACKFRHVCEICRGPHHKGSCPGEKGTADA
jgi:nucleoid DNA-binding protein